MSNVAELRDVSFSYRGVPVLDEVNLTLGKRDYVAILGPNGSGKSTLLKVLLGLIRPQRGLVTVLGGALSGLAAEFGYVPQNARFDLDFPIRVIDVVLMGRLHARRPMHPFAASDQECARMALARVEMDDYAARPIGALSGGQLQRVLIARALALAPELLLLDEPMAGLDERIGQSVWQLLDALARDMTVVIVTHDVSAISHHVGTVACLNRRLFAHPASELNAELLESIYGCPVEELLAHGRQPHRVLGHHGDHSHGSDAGSGAGPGDDRTGSPR